MQSEALWTIDRPFLRNRCARQHENGDESGCMCRSASCLQSGSFRSPGRPAKPNRFLGLVTRLSALLQDAKNEFEVGAWGCSGAGAVGGGGGALSTQTSDQCQPPDRESSRSGGNYAASDRSLRPVEDDAGSTASWSRIPWQDYHVASSTSSTNPCGGANWFFGIF